jgi:hypothetical protein
MTEKLLRDDTFLKGVCWMYMMHKCESSIWVCVPSCDTKFLSGVSPAGSIYTLMGRGLHKIQFTLWATCFIFFIWLLIFMLPFVKTLAMWPISSECLLLHGTWSYLFPVALHLTLHVFLSFGISLWLHFIDC